MGRAVQSDRSDYGRQWIPTYPLFWSYVLDIPQELLNVALHFAHEIESGHLGTRKPIAKAESLFYWPNLRVDMCRYVSECKTCQQCKGTQGLRYKWQEPPAVTAPMQRVSVDLMDMHAGSHGYRYMLTVLDHYSRYVRFYPLKSKAAGEVSRNLKKFVAAYGAPTLVLLDNGGGI